MANQGRLLSTKEVAQYLNVTVNTVKLWLKHGKINGKKIGRDWRIDPEGLRDLVPEGALYGFADDKLKELAKAVYPEEWNKCQEQHQEIDKEQLLNEVRHKYSEELARRFPYPYESDEVVTHDKDGQPRYGQDEEVYQHYYQTKLKEEQRKLDKLFELMQKKYGVQDADAEEIKRTMDNVLILKLSGYE